MYKINNALLNCIGLSVALCSNPAIAVPLLHNDENNLALEAQHIDANIPHYEYEEELERGVISRSIEYEINELTDLEEDIIEESIATPNYNGVDTSNRTNFLSNDDYSSSYQIDVLGSSSDFYYLHQLPPSVNPGDPLFNTYDFTTALLEFELEIDGYTTDDPLNSSYEVRIMAGETFAVDANNELFLQTAGTDIGLLGELSFSSLYDGRYHFEFEFEQYDDLVDANEVFISDEIYEAIADGVLGIHIVRTSGDGNLFLQESEIELEKAANVSEPASWLLLGGFMPLLLAKRMRRRQLS